MSRSRALDGKVALVTGGARGIGRAIALRLAEEGADIAINYQYTKEQAQKVSKLINQIGAARQLEKVSSKIDQVDSEEQAKELSDLIESAGRHSYICQTNVGDVDQVERMCADVIKELGTIDILVNNAGIVRDKSFAKMTPEMWREVLSVNLDGAFYCSRAVISGMLERKFGRIINVSSVVGRMGNWGQANYAASKAGLIGLTRTLAKEFAAKGITVNAIAPGFIETDMLRAVPEAVMEKVVAQIPMRRLGRAAEIAGAVAYLVSADGGYITGQVLDVNGGLFIG